MSSLHLHRLVLAAAVVAAIGVPAASHAATKSTTFQVLATIVSDCSITSAPNIDFGNVGVTTANTHQTSNLVITCTPGTTYTLALDAGTGTGSTIAARKMAGPGGNTLAYSLYRDSGRTQNWGNTIGTDTVGGTGTGSGVTHTIYARLPSQTTPPVGAYASTVTVTVAY